jgi:hypothetical protein
MLQEKKKKIVFGQYFCSIFGVQWRFYDLFLTNLRMQLAVKWQGVGIFSLVLIELNWYTSESICKLKPISDPVAKKKKLNQVKYDEY